MVLGMDRSLRQRVPFQITFADGYRLVTQSLSLSEERLVVLLDPAQGMPVVGSTGDFFARVASVPVLGTARVVSTRSIDTAQGVRELVVDLDVVHLDSHSREHLRRSVFRDRVIVEADHDPAAERVLAYADHVGDTVAVGPDTTPLDPDSARVPTLPTVFEPDSTARWSSPDDAAHPKTGRKRPSRPERHHWENESRFTRWSD